MHCRTRLLIALLAASPAIATAQAPADRPTTFGVKGGFVLPGAFYWHEGPYASYDLSLSWTAGGFVDHMLAEKLSGGLYVDLNFMNAFDESAVMFDLGATLKARIGRSADRISWRPLIGVGYGNMGSIYLFSATSYLTLRAGSEAVFALGKHQALVEGLILGSPTGGNEDVTTTFGPVFLMRFGLLF
jgi:hypothetical protein